MTGTIINAGTVVAGSLIGLLLKQKLPARISKTVMMAVGLVTVFIGISMAQDTKNILIPLASLAIGGALGEMVDIDTGLDNWGRKFEEKLGKNDGNFARAFVGSSLLFVVGPMTIIGAIEDGLKGDYSLLLTKAIMDGISSIAFASSLGIGVLFSAITILVYQGLLTLGASALKAVLSDPVVAEMTSTGGLMILGLGLNILEVTRIKVANFLPSLVIAVLIAWVVG